MLSLPLLYAVCVFYYLLVGLLGEKGMNFIALFQDPWAASSPKGLAPKGWDESLGSGSKKHKVKTTALTSEICMCT